MLSSHSIITPTNALLQNLHIKTLKLLPTCFGPKTISREQGKEIQLPDDGLRTETCRSSFSVLMCKFYISGLVGIIIE